MQNELIFSHPDRPKPRLKPMVAFHYFRKLMANKDDTKQAYFIFEALTGKSLIKDLNRLAQSEHGQLRIKERRILPPLLDDHKRLKKLAPNSVGAAYVKFMESENLSAAGLVNEYDSFMGNAPKYDDVVEWYNNRLRDTHDLLHVLTGYGRDAIGEACVQAFSYGQNKSLGALMISYLGGLEVKRHVPFSIGVIGAVNEGRQNGKKASKISDQNIMELLKMPLQEAREVLYIPQAIKYHNVIEELESNKIEPMSVLANY